MNTAAIILLASEGVGLLFAVWLVGAIWGMDTETPARKQAIGDAYMKGYEVGHKAGSVSVKDRLHAALQADQTEDD